MGCSLFPFLSCDSPFNTCCLDLLSHQDAVHIVHSVVGRALGHVLRITLKQLIRQGALLLRTARVAQAGLVGGIAPGACSKHKVARIGERILVGVIQPALAVRARRQAREGLHEAQAGLVHNTVLILQRRLRLLNCAVVVGKVGVVELLLCDLPILHHLRPVHLLGVVHGALQVLGAPQALTLRVNAEVDDHDAATGCQLARAVQQHVAPVTSSLCLEGRKQRIVLGHLAVVDVLVAKAAGLAAQPVHAGGCEAEVQSVVRHSLKVEGATHGGHVHTALVLLHVGLQAAGNLELAQSVAEHRLPLVRGLILVVHPHVARRLSTLDLGHKLVVQRDRGAAVSSTVVTQHDGASRRLGDRVQLLQHQLGVVVDDIEAAASRQRVQTRAILTQGGVQLRSHRRDWDMT
mmetsp:Transcript_13394/g.33749  ORF Transcript_13394/g.33749 Transcript_13394/m.33749 type:complete len:405 (-) Transcript_13394:129-1343(-)